MNELALFAGAGGGILGGILNGWRTVCAVEINKYCRRVLMQRQDDGILEPFPIWDDVETFDGRPWAGCVDIVTGGFPCQDISVAGKGAGIDGERSGLWREMARIIGEVRPRFVLVENSPALTIRGGVRVIGDLAALGYDTKWGVVGAHHAGAPHKRDRIWILANANGEQLRDEQKPREECEAAPESANDGSPQFMANADSLRELQPVIDVAHAASKRQPGQGQSWYTCDPAEDCKREATQPEFECIHTIGGIESRMGRVAHGVANRVDRLKAIGNGQVPAVVNLAGRVLK